MRILIVEDNDELARLTATGLKTAGYAADHVATAADARHTLATNPYALVLLDLGLPDSDGLALLREMRERKDSIPVLVVTARTGVSDRVEGLRTGADDYLIKPFALEELVARIEALMRRPRQLEGRSLAIQNVSVDTTGHQAFVDDRPMILPARELSVLEILLRRKGRVVPKQLVEDLLFGMSDDGSPNAIEVYIHRLRRQLADHGAKVQIHTIRGVGYLLKETAD